MTHYNSVDELVAAVGGPEYVSEWLTIDQERITRFADATDDHQWIHVDPERAATGPFGATVAHGYLTLSLISSFMFDAVSLEGSSLVINYGLERVRFLTPVVVNSRIRGRAELVGVTPGDSGVRVNTRVTIEIDGVEKPALVAETIALFVLGQ
jgi:acyl dehydratase